MTAADDDRDEVPSTRGFSGLIAEARPDDPAALVLARARVAGALFGATAGLGRFRVLERLGAGGMGAVYAAYDPQLDRGVALKTVHVPERRHEAALAEAKALARLAHPNVVPVFDVGIEGDEVYIVMELVRGDTLRTWVKGRPVAEILDAYRQAGHALAAAHAAGLVHRDFKPDNAIVGVDGRVRVVDFGLACEAGEAIEPGPGDGAVRKTVPEYAIAGTSGGAGPERLVADTPDGAGPERLVADTPDGAGPERLVAGTPRYMAPEQAAGCAVTPAADQYSFCVALAEALGDRELPAWLAVILERGRASQPSERFASIAELVRALGRDPIKIRRRRMVGGLAVAVVAIAFLVGRAMAGADHAVCEGGEAELVQTWHPGARAAALARVAMLGAYGRELAPRLEQQLRGHARSWATERRDACLAHDRGMQTEAQFERRIACLDRSRIALSTVADVITRSDAPQLPDVAVAVREIPDPAACAHAEALIAGVEPPAPLHAQKVKQLREDLERVRIEIAAGRLEAARIRVDTIVAEARRIQYPPLLAEALLVAGEVMAVSEDRDHAVPTLREATLIAMGSHVDAMAVEAWARHGLLCATSDRFHDTLAGRALIEALAARPSCDGFPRALLYSSIGSMAIAQGERPAARVAFERALADTAKVTGPGSVELAAVHRGLAKVTDDPAQRDVILVKLEAAQNQLLGADHPETLDTRLMRAQSSVVHLADAAAILDDTCGRLALYAMLKVRTAQCWAQLGDVRRDLGDPARADAALDEAVRFDAAHNRFLPELVPYRSLWRGQVAVAIQQFTAAVDTVPRRPREPWFVTLDRAKRSLGLGRAYRAAGQAREAQRILEAVVDDLEPLARQYPTVTHDRLLARARTELAYSAPPTDQTIAGARAALAWWRLAGGDPAEIARLEHWITAASDSLK